MSEQESSTPASPWETAHEADRRSRMDRWEAVYEGAPPIVDNLDTQAIETELRVLRRMRAEIASVLGLDGDTDPIDLVHEVRTAVIERQEAREWCDRHLLMLEKGRQPFPAIDPARLPEGTILLSGPQAERYRALEAAAKRSLAAQTELTAAGAELRDAISGLCQALAPPG